MANRYAVLDEVEKPLLEFESADSKARKDAISAAIALAEETGNTYAMRNEATDFHWSVSRRGIVVVGPLGEADGVEHGPLD